jgi:hypothetical protein
MRDVQREAEEHAACEKRGTHDDLKEGAMSDTRELVCHAHESARPQRELLKNILAAGAQLAGSATE